MLLYNNGTDVGLAFNRVVGNVVGNVSGSAATANTLTTARTIAISGNVTGTATSFDGSGNISIPVTAINADGITSGTINNARTTASSSNGASTIVARDGSGNFTANVITANGSAITSINASNISSGTVATARLGSGTANNTTFLRGDQTYATPSGGLQIDTNTTNNATNYAIGVTIIVANESGASGTTMYPNQSVTLYGPSINSTSAFSVPLGFSTSTSNFTGSQLSGTWRCRGTLFINDGDGGAVGQSFGVRGNDGAFRSTGRFSLFQRTA
jgi:hypothetical protein